jgi:hypothetical protein
MRNLLLQVNEVTNDAWIATFAAMPQTIFSGRKKANDPGKGPGYLASSARQREAAKLLTKLTGRKWTPSEVQETVWSWAYAMFNTLDAKGETRTARELLRSGDLEPIITEVPDFRTLFHKDSGSPGGPNSATETANDYAYGRVLRDAGYGDKINSLPLPDRGDVETVAAPFDQDKLMSLFGNHVFRHTAYSGTVSATVRVSLLFWLLSSSLFIKRRKK